jgi:hypothetical protein
LGERAGASRKHSMGANSRHDVMSFASGISNSVDPIVNSHNNLHIENEGSSKTHNHLLHINHHYHNTHHKNSTVSVSKSASFN